MFSAYNPYDKLEELEQKLDLAYDTLRELSRVNQELAHYTTQLNQHLNMIIRKTEYLNQRLTRLEKEYKDGKTEISTATTTSRSR